MKGSSLKDRSTFGVVALQHEEKFIRVLLTTTPCMARVCFNGQMDEYSMETFTLAGKTEREFTIGLVVKFMREISKTTSVQVREHFTTPMVRYL